MTPDILTPDRTIHECGYPMNLGQEQSFVSWDGTRLATCHWPTTINNRSGHPVVIIHGLGEHFGRYHDLATRLVAAGHSVYGFDWRGHGRSPGPRGDAPGFHYWVEDAAAFLEWVAEQHAAKYGGLGSRNEAVVNRIPRVVAHSLGGAVALHVALKYPQLLDKLFLISPYFRPAFQPEAWRLAIARSLRSLCPSLALNVGLRWEQFAHDREVQSAIKQDLLCHQKLSVRMALQVLQAGECLLSPTRRLEVRCRIAHGDEDTINSYPAAKQFADQQRTNTDFYLLAGGAHQIHNDQATRDQVFTLLSEFLASFASES